MKVGDNEVKDILIGDTQVLKVYRGEDVVWEKSVSPLPSGYTRVQYLESDGVKQYIDTAITPRYPSFGFYIDYMVLTEVDRQHTSAKLFGSSKRNAGFWGGVIIASYPAQTGFSGQMAIFSRIDYARNDPMIVGYQRMWSKLENCDRYSSSTGANYIIDKTGVSTVNTYGSLWLFTIHSEATVTGAGVRIYECTLYENETETAHFIPCLDTNNRPCFYDTVTQQTFYNQGTGEFGYETMDGTIVSPT